MQLIVFKIHICGASDKYYSRKVMIAKPHKTIKKILTLHYCRKKDIQTVADLIAYIKKSIPNLSESIGNFGIENFNVENLYIKHRGYLIGFAENKRLCNIFNFFRKRKIELIYMYVAGGASLDHHGYKFIVRSDEERHKNMPHIHVEKDGVAPRYLLSNLERIASDECLKDHLRDEKKIIKPYIKKNIQWFNEKWNMNVNGYIPPVEIITGQQLCKET